MQKFEIFVLIPEESTLIFLQSSLCIMNTISFPLNSIVDTLKTIFLLHYNDKMQRRHEISICHELNIGELQILLVFPSFLIEYLKNAVKRSIIFLICLNCNYFIYFVSFYLSFSS